MKFGSDGQVCEMDGLPVCIVQQRQEIRSWEMGVMESEKPLVLNFCYLLPFIWSYRNSRHFMCDITVKTESDVFSVA